MSRARSAIFALVVLAGAGCSAADIELTKKPGPKAPDGRATVNASIVLPGAPADAPALFGGELGGDETDPAHAPHIVYPSHETMFPRNIARPLHQWRAPDALDLFEVRFDSDVARVRYYTTDRSLQPDASTWSALAATHAGASVRLTVRGLRRDAPRTIHRSPEVTLHFSSSDVLGALYYWSTGTSGIMRAHVAATSATKFYTDPAADDGAKCVACHTVSRDGRKLAAGYDGERLRAIRIPTREVLIPSVASGQAPTMDMPDPMMAGPTMPEPMMPPDPMAHAGPAYGWGTFSPDASRLLYANKGALTLLDADSGELLAEVALPAGRQATHPDWSPDGRYVAITYVASDREIGNKEVSGSSIARLPVLAGDAFGEPEVLVESTKKDDTLFFPVYSPDSRWLAFVRARGKSKDGKSAEIFLIDADGEGEPIALSRLNHRARGEDDVADLGNTMPTWAPSTRGDVLWLAFSSIRDYGDVLAGEQRDQLWAAAIEPARIANGDDPSYAAFWLPFQDVQENNHRAFWALAPEEECPSTMELCDDLDNDCDGIVDESCCTPEPEVCGDGRDNDCNGVADEHCACDEVEICDNGMDDDCDMDVDEDCLI